MILLKTELATITGGLRLSFGVALNGIDVKSPTEETASISTWNMTNGSGVQVTTYPYITLDISKDRYDVSKKYGYSINFAGINKFFLEQAMTEVLRAFKKDAGVFYASGGVPGIYSERADKYTTYALGSKDKQISFKPAILEDLRDNKRYEGVLIAIREYGNNMIVTYSEFVYILSIIKKLDMQNMAFNLINTFYGFDSRKRIINTQKRMEALGISVTKMAENQVRFQKGLAGRLNALESNLSQHEGGAK